MNIAILLSGGTGSRLGEAIPKQYLKIKERMIISYSLEVLEKSEQIDGIQIVAEEDWQEHILQYKISKLKGFSKPGMNRQSSIFNALKDIRLYGKEDDIIIIHDAARPFLTKNIIDDLIIGIKYHEGAIPVLPMKDTVYLSDDGQKITSLLNRNQVFAGQAPEAFYFEPYYQANLRLLPDEILKINGSTEVAILSGMDIAMIPGDENNIKITTKKDLDLFYQRISESK